MIKARSLATLAHRQGVPPVTGSTSLPLLGLTLRYRSRIYTVLCPSNFHPAKQLPVPIPTTDPTELDIIAAVLDYRDSIIIVETLVSSQLRTASRLSTVYLPPIIAIS